MHMAEAFAHLQESRRDGGFFDVHVKQIANQFHVFGSQRFQETHSIGDSIYDIGLVAVEWFEQQRNSGGMRPFAETFESLAKPRHGLLAYNVAFATPLHRADNCRSAEVRCEINNI